MKLAGITVAVALAAAGMAQGAIYTDTQNEIFDNNHAHLDIASVLVTHDASTITFEITTRGDVSNPTWGKYMIAINGAGGANDAGNGWGRPISWNGQGIDFWVGTWADDGGSNFGGELRQMDGFGGNTLLAATYAGPGISGSSLTTQVVTLSRSLLGLTSDGTFYFDVMSSGGGNDPGVDHLSRSDMATNDWGVPSSSGQFLAYTIPSPGSIALLGLGGLALARRRR
ncbi:MAG TPA: MYXO-CTERM sorting domain-containing protein [Phycisphaerales bacterium]|nr:MYXO-CTERM sorting domain-containing protein [Phycisphaerales bacterium]